MKELKFRAWDRILKQFVYIEIQNGRLDLQILTHGGKPAVSDLEDWKQCSGLKDKKGFEIYEGDILRGSVISENVYVWEAVNLNYYHHWQETVDAIDEGKSIEIIGNIYENPELLK